ncbi:MAG: DUF3892 domain-containing protein [Pseudomonadota bacterium]
MGGSWGRRLLDDAIRDVELDPHSYYTAVNGRSVWVVVRVRNGRKYLKTEADGANENNLLSLPECA